MEDRLLFVISPPRAGSTLLQRMLGSHSQISTCPEPHLITPLAFLGYHDSVDKAPYDHINAAEAIKGFVAALPRGEADYFDALRAYCDTLYGRMLAETGKRYFLDKTPAYALVLPFLTRLYPRAAYVVLTRHPIAVASSYAESFFDGDWRAANEFNPIVNRYVPAIARLLQNPPERLHHVQYERLVRDPERELAAMFRFLDLPDQPQAVHYGSRFDALGNGRGDPLGVSRHDRPVDDSVDSWADALARDPESLALAQEIAASLDDGDVRCWGYDKPRLLAPVVAARANAKTTTPTKAKLSKFLLQRRVFLALKKDIHKRPHGRVLERVRYYCNVLLRE